jgi:inosine/xanthosine triphosphatase
MKIVVASKNPVKIAAVEQGVALMFPDRKLEIIGYSVPSEVADQPLTDAETKAGAFNRVKNVALLDPLADLFVAIEGGIEDVPDIHGTMHMTAFAWVMVMDKHNIWGEARSASFQLPEAVATRVRGGEELGIADDAVFGQSNSKQQNGAVGLLTHNAVTRSQLYVMPMALALIPHRNAELYKSF